MSYTITNQRKQTMLERIGEAAELIDNLQYLPFYRSAQIKLEKMGKASEWPKMIATAKQKSSPSRYFAKMCKMVKDGTYRFTEKVKEVTGEMSLYLHDKLVRFGFGKYQKYWVRKAQEFVNVNSQAGLIELLEFAERKDVSQKYIARALLNCKSPREYYQQNVLGVSK